MNRTRIVTVSIDEELYEKLKEYARKRYGGGKGSIKKALEEFIRSGLEGSNDDLFRRLERGYKLGGPLSRDEIYGERS